MKLDMTAKWLPIPLSLLLLPQAARGDTLEVTYPAIERLIVEKILVEGGRRYLQGGPDDTCTYSFVQEPRVSASEGRLRIRFLFAGSVGTEITGRCIGRGGNFDVIVSGVPAYEDGTLFLEDLRFESDNGLFDLFFPIVESQLRPALRVPLQSAVEEHLSQLVTAARVRVEELTVSEIRLGPDAATLTAELRVDVRP
jgi:hypothetical protein